METKEYLKILLFEKNESIGQLLCEFMRMNDFHADMFSSPEEAARAFAQEKYSIGIISLEISSLQESFALAKKLKSSSPDLILIFLATNPAIETITQAYTLGADDFIRKPFILEELQMRIIAIIRRAHLCEIPDVPSYQIGKFLFEPKKQLLTIDGVCSKITTKESDLLKYLCENMNVLVLREDVLKTVWKNNSYYNARSMDVYITKLRRLLKADNHVGIINVHGKGYKLLVI
jgi:DNA-binding response OmpR family regulator